MWTAQNLRVVGVIVAFGLGAEAPVALGDFHFTGTESNFTAPPPTSLYGWGRVPTAE
jgi:hypothetical protein